MGNNCTATPKLYTLVFKSIFLPFLFLHQATPQCGKLLLFKMLIIITAFLSKYYRLNPAPFHSETLAFQVQVMFH